MRAPLTLTCAALLALAAVGGATFPGVDASGAPAPLEAGGTAGADPTGPVALGGHYEVRIPRCPDRGSVRLAVHPEPGDGGRALVVILGAPLQRITADPVCVEEMLLLFTPLFLLTPGTSQMEYGSLYFTGSWKGGWSYRNPHSVWTIGKYGNGCRIAIDVKAPFSKLEGTVADLAKCPG